LPLQPTLEMLQREASPKNFRRFPDFPDTLFDTFSAKRVF